jgi:NAD(P)-dependent dehydrogenase (short-subunit alcohol dehydrogenase family)
MPDRSTMSIGGPMQRLPGKVAFVTGAGGVIGRAICLTLGMEGAAVACVDVDRASGEETARQVAERGGVARFFGADLSDRAAAQEAVARVDKELGGLDVLVNNAMWISYDAIEDVREEVVEKMFGIGLKAVIWTIQAAVEPLGRRGGSIVNVSSIAAMRGTEKRIVYCTVKGGLAAMTVQCAVELGPRGIRVNAIAPGLVLHGGSERRLGPELIQQRRDTTPLGRLATSDDMASAVLFLASDDSRFVTGTTIPVDGGRRIRY